MNNEETFILDEKGEKIHGAWYTKKGCVKCYERGYSCWDVKTKEKIPCKCLKFVRRIETNENV